MSDAATGDTPLAGSLVVNIGDMLQVLSNGAFVATSHWVRGVRLLGQEARHIPSRDSAADA